MEECIFIYCKSVSEKVEDTIQMPKSVAVPSSTIAVTSSTPLSFFQKTTTKPIKPTFASSHDNSFFYPKQKDTLFWCFYILKYGFESYEMLGPINIVIEKKIKIEYIELLRKKKQELKAKKIAQMAHVENKLANDFIIDLKTFFMLCAVEKINILYIHKKFYYLFKNGDFEEDDDDIKDNDNNNDNAKSDVTNFYGEIHLVKRNDVGNRYGFSENISSEKVAYYRNTFYCVENISKPIRGVSNYTIKDLLPIANKLGIEVVNSLDKKQKTKNELYESIVQYFS
jgi:hypothetical protein